jgi:plasmid stability protein
MAQVLIRDLDAKTVLRLKARARGNRRSLQAELKAILDGAAQDKRQDLRATMKRLQGMFDGRTFSDSAALIREDRDR